MELEWVIKPLHTHEELERVVEIQKIVWGLDGGGATSPISLRAWAMDIPETSVLLGAFLEEEMVAFVLFLPTLTPKTAYGHMLGVLEPYRDSGIGMSLLMAVRDRLVECGITYCHWTYEPLESRNAHMYLNRMGGRAVSYQTGYYNVDCDMHRGLPLDRFVTLVDLCASETTSGFQTLDDALCRYPLAGPEFMPDSPVVLVPIPGDLDSLKLSDMEAAYQARMTTRAVFLEYLNNRGYVAERLVSGKTEGRRMSCYVLEKGRAA
ncbi:GNAT family N-acetyltransferase [Pseudodesulfovibrio tunisiensis]|uniref:GNAT family N-acetyltransferase n=1 Tax=Pseudodesulfovibrio tunisiensis TaxID=463192 RepID=UPI001FB3C82D|nr:GNAT family N-acetyltransferase [Pseudodesulfovibrio tunisiensis]